MMNDDFYQMDPRMAMAMSSAQPVAPSQAATPLETAEVKPVDVTGTASDDTMGKGHFGGIDPEGLKKYEMLTGYAAIQAGMKPEDINNLGSVPREQQSSFVRNLKAIFDRAKQPGSPAEEAATKAYFGALFTGAGQAGASAAYSDVFKQQAQLGSIREKEMALKKLEFDMKYGASVGEAQRVSNKIKSDLGKIGLANELPDLDNRIRQIFIESHEKPEQAAYMSRRLLINAQEAGFPEEAIIKIADQLPRYASAETQREEQAYRDAKVGDSFIKRWRHGLASGEEIIQAREKVRKRGLELKGEEAAQAATIENEKKKAWITGGGAGAEAAVRAQADIQKGISEAGGGGIAQPRINLSPVPAPALSSATGAPVAAQPRPPAGVGTAAPVTPATPAAGQAPAPRAVSQEAKNAPPEVRDFVSSLPSPEALGKDALTSYREANKKYEENLVSVQDGVQSQRAIINSLIKDVDQYPELFGRVSKNGLSQTWVNWAKNQEDKQLKNQLMSELGLTKKEREQFDRIQSSLAQLVLYAKTSVTARLADSNSDAKAITDTVANIFQQPGAAKASLQKLDAALEYSNNKLNRYSEILSSAPNASARFRPAQFEKWYINKYGPIMTSKIEQARESGTGAKPVAPAQGSGQWRIVR